MKIYFVSSSDNKAQELAKVLGERHELIRLEADLPEIQSLDPRQIIRHKLQEAKQLFTGKTIIVEDTSLEIDALNGLPGPFIKFFEELVDDEGIYQMARGVQPTGKLIGRAIVVIGLLHKGKIKFFEGAIEGSFQRQQREGWGFDRIFIPDGYKDRMGTLGPEVKSKISHRAVAAKALKKHLDVIG